MTTTEPVTYIPLDRAAICANCDAIHVLADCCPGCGSDNVMALARWIGRVNDDSPFGVAGGLPSRVRFLAHPPARRA